MGLRARQKADRQRRILQAASDLFRASGYDAVHIEAIAACAEVSVGTFYNYFQGKGDLLLATVAMEVEEVLAAGALIVADPPGEVAAALDRLIGCYYEHSLVYLTKEMWRAAMAQATLQPATPFGRRYGELDALLCAQVCALLSRLQTRGRIAAGLDCRALGEVIFNNLNAMFAEFAKDEAMTVGELRAAVARQTAPVAMLMTARG